MVRQAHHERRSEDFEKALGIGGYGAIFVGLWIYWLAEHGTGKSISTDNTAP